MRQIASSIGIALGLSLLALGCPRTASVSADEPSGSPLELVGVECADLTNRERGELRALLDALLAPCPDVAVSVGDCIRQQRACPACRVSAQFLARQIRAGKPRNLAVELFDARFDPGRKRTIAIGDSPSSGPSNAPVTIVKWADFQCPACAGMATLLEELAVRFPGQIRLVYKHYPISYHTHAELAARASLAAHRQGKFWPMHHLLYGNRQELSALDLERYASELGLDLDRYRRDLDDPEVRGAVERDRRQGETLAIRSTPTIFINGREVPMAVLQDPLAELEDWVRTEIELGGGSTQAIPTGHGRAPAGPDTPRESKP